MWTPWDPPIIDFYVRTWRGDGHWLIYFLHSIEIYVPRALYRQIIITFHSKETAYFHSYHPLVSLPLKLIPVEGLFIHMDSYTIFKAAGTRLDFVDDWKRVYVRWESFETMTEAFRVCRRAVDEACSIRNATTRLSLKCLSHVEIWSNSPRWVIISTHTYVDEMDRKWEEIGEGCLVFVVGWIRTEWSSMVWVFAACEEWVALSASVAEILLRDSRLVSLSANKLFTALCSSHIWNLDQMHRMDEWYRTESERCLFLRFYWSKHVQRRKISEGFISEDQLTWRNDHSTSRTNEKRDFCLIQFSCINTKFVHCTVELTDIDVSSGTNSCG